LKRFNPLSDGAGVATLPFVNRYLTVAYKGVFRNLRNEGPSGAFQRPQPSTSKDAKSLF